MIFYSYNSFNQACNNVGELSGEFEVLTSSHQSQRESLQIVINT